jgi:hypothetical protein
MILAMVVVLFFGIILGYGIATYVIARDPDLVKLEKDQQIIKRPDAGLVLAAVTPEILRRIVTSVTKDPTGSSDEARSLYEKK